jgi:hypothetical protein
MGGGIGREIIAIVTNKSKMTKIKYKNLPNGVRGDKRGVTGGDIGTVFFFGYSSGENPRTKILKSQCQRIFTM